MQNMKKELKIGILAVAVLVATFFVINFLRGKDLWNKEYELSSTYEDVQGLLPSSPVYIKGYKAGTVTEVTYSKEKGAFDVLCTISRDFPVPEDSRMTIYSADLMGGKAIRIDMGKSPNPAEDGAVLTPSVSPDMLSSIAAGIEPLISKGSDVLDNLDNALTNLNLTLSEENRESLRNIMENLDRTIAEIEQIVGTVEDRKDDIDSFIANLNGFLLSGTKSHANPPFLHGLVFQPLGRCFDRWNDMRNMYRHLSHAPAVYFLTGSHLRGQIKWFAIFPAWFQKKVLCRGETRSGKDRRHRSTNLETGHRQKNACLQLVRFVLPEWFH